MSHDTICTGTKIAAVADAIRAKSGSSAPMTLDDMPDAIGGLRTGSGGAIAALVAKTLTEIPEADTITVVSSGIFSYNTQIVGEVVLPNATEIWSNAFDRCSGITALSAPKCKKAYEIGMCVNVERVDFPKLEWFRGGFRFGKLTEACLPECTYFDGSFFGGNAGCPLIERIRLPKVKEQPAGSTKGALVSNLSALKSICMDSVESVEGGTYGTSRLMYNCPALDAVYLPALKTLGDGTFYGCGSLTSLWLPSCTRIDRDSIEEGVPIDTIVLPGDTMCRITYVNGFETSFPITEGTGYIYVPASLADAYRQDECWSCLASQIRAIEDYPDVVAQARAKAESAAQGWD